MHHDDITFLRLAIDLAHQARQAGADPFGAVLVRDGVVLAQASDRSVEYSDPTSHAELNVISTYCRENKVFSLEGCTLYTSTEPCMMCSGAIHWAKISRVVFSVSQAMLQAMSGGKPKPSCNSVVNIDWQRVAIVGPVLPKEGLSVFEGYNWPRKSDRHAILFGKAQPPST